MSQGCALWMSESKCQRSRSQCSDYWKWFLAHNCFPFTSAIIKLHAQIPCESRICLTDIGVKNLRSLNWLPRGVFVPLGQPHSSWLLLQNRLMDFDETWYAWSTHGPLQVLLFFGQIRPGADPGRGRNRSLGVPFFKKLLLQSGRFQRQTECIAMT